MKTLSIEKRGEDRIARGHPWVFANQVREDLKTFEAGELVEILNHRGSLLGRGYINPHSLIAARLLTREREEIDVAFFRRRLLRARDFRERFLPGAESYRWVFSEADGLSGVVLDRYGGTLAVQLMTAGAQVLGEVIREAIMEVFNPDAVMLRNDSPVRKLEGLELTRSLWHGELEEPVEIAEGGLRFLVDVEKGQKTGFYFDQRDNRSLLAGLRPAGQLLDCFCYTGAWTLSLAAANPGISVLGIDESRSALKLARQNASLNELDRYVSFERADVFEALEELARAKKRFECVVLDPPALVKSRAKILEGYRGYRRLHRLAGRVVARRGLLATSCCSYHMSFDRFGEAVAEGLSRAKRRSRVVMTGRQARDHPVHPAIPESSYLKFMLLELD